MGGLSVTLSTGGYLALIEATFLENALKYFFFFSFGRGKICEDILLPSWCIVFFAAKHKIVSLKHTTYVNGRARVTESSRPVAPLV